MGKQRNNSILICPYCRIEFRHCDGERDHVPPKSLFPRPWPSQLITVRCCSKCHDLYSVGDEALRYMAMAGIGDNEEKRNIQPLIDRSLVRNPWWKKEITKYIEQSEPIEFRSLGTNLEAPISVEMFKIPLSNKLSAAIDTSIKRIGTGLLFNSHPEFDTSIGQVDVKQLNPEEWLFHGRQIEALPERSHSLKIGKFAFAGSWGVTNKQDAALMILSFYGWLNFVLFFNLDAE